MPPKKSQPKNSNHRETTGEDASPPKQESNLKDDHQYDEGHTTTKDNGASSKKRKASKPIDTSNKTPRRSARGGTQPVPDSVKVLNYLLSPSSLDLCSPKDEREDLKNRGEGTRTYSTTEFNPFEELTGAVILSRPIAHMLGLRSIRTIFNPPYDLTTPKKIREAGYDGCRKALDHARTQHRQKTAEELVILADAVVDHLGSGEEDVTLDRVREESGHDAIKEREMLKKHVKGLGKTGLDIFGRRIQWMWPAFYPFVDDRTATAVEKLGMPKVAEELKEVMEKHWEQLKIEDIQANDVEEKKRKAFVRILERAVGADLEGNMESIKAELA